MKRAKVNAIVDMVAFGVLLLSVFTGIIPWKALPSGGGGPRAGREAAHALFLGLERGVWREFHTYTSLALVALIAVHLLLHWQWIRCIPRFFAPMMAKPCEARDICQPHEPQGKDKERGDSPEAL